MADNVTIESIPIATDDVGGFHYQKVKVVIGGDDAATQIANTEGSRLPVELGQDNPLTLQASQVSGTTNATNTRTTTTGLGKYTDLQVLINITGAGAVTGLLQIWLEDSSDGGTTWDDLVSSNTFAFGAALVKQQFAISGRVATTKVQGSAPQQETLAAGQVRHGPWGDRIRVREKVSGVSGSPTGVTYTITAVAKR